MTLYAIKRLLAAGATPITVDEKACLTLGDAGQYIIKWFFDLFPNAFQQVTTQEHYASIVRSAKVATVELTATKCVGQDGCEPLAIEAINAWLNEAEKQTVYPVFFEEDDDGTVGDTWSMRIYVPLDGDETELPDAQMLHILSQDAQSGYSRLPIEVTLMHTVTETQGEEQDKKAAYAALKQKFVQMCAIYGIPEASLIFPEI